MERRGPGVVRVALGWIGLSGGIRLILHGRQKDGVCGGGAGAAFEAEVGKNGVTARGERRKNGVEIVTVFANRVKMSESIASFFANQKQMHEFAVVGNEEGSVIFLKEFVADFEVEDSVGPGGANIGG